MGKKQKGGRRQILQLDEKKKVKNDSELSTNANNEACPLDSQVADFFKEIDALTVNEESLDSKENEELEKEETSESEINNGEKCVDITVQEAESENTKTSYCAWQRIKDDSTGYCYYWNVETNEVTWDVPEEYTAYSKSVLLSNNGNVDQQDENESFSTLQRKKEAQLKEGSIIPISYYGGSSSEESLSDDNASHVFKIEEKSPERVKKKNEKSTKKKVKNTKLINNSKELEEVCISGSVIGPQLPPDFHFPQDVPETIDCIETEFSIKTKFNSENNTISNNSLIDSKTCKDVSSDGSTIKVPVTFSQDTPKSTSYEHLEKELKNYQDTVVKRDTSSGSLDSTALQKKNETTQGVIFGLKPVVEYDSFTDEEEEVDETRPNDTPIETPSVEFVKSDNDEHMKEDIHSDSSIPVAKLDVTPIEQPVTVKNISTEVSPGGLVKESNLNKSATFGAKRVHGDDLEELSRDFTDNFVKYGIKKQKLNDDEYSAKFWAGVDAHLSYEKQHGLGFKENSKEYFGDEPSCSSTNTYPKHNYKSVSFVKSSHILDLNYLNNSLLNETNKELSDDENPFQKSSEKSTFAASTITENIVTESLVPETKNVDSSDIENKNDSAVIQTSTSRTTSKETGSTILTHSIHIESKETNVPISAPVSDIESKGTCAAVIRDNISTFDYEDDIDEIDKALCEALEAKKVADKSLKCSALESLEKVASESCDDDKFTKGESTKAATDELLPDSNITFDMAETLVDKLEFLYSLHSDLTSLSILLIQLQTRFMDWQSGALKHDYFTNRLKEVDQYIREYEGSLTSGDWIAKWDSSQKRYIYMNKETKLSQSQYTEYLAKEEMSFNKMQSETSSTTATSTTQNEFPDLSAAVSDPQSASNSPFKLEEHQDSQSASNSPFNIEGNQNELVTSSSNWSCETSPPPPPPGVDSPPPLPPSSPPPHNPPPPPLDNSEIGSKLPEDMDLENSNDSCSYPIISKNVVYEENEIKYTSMNVCSSSSKEENLVNTYTVASVNSDVPSSDGLNSISVNPQTFSVTSNIFTDNIPIEDLKTDTTSASLQFPNNHDFCQSSCSSTKSEEVKTKTTSTTSGPAPKKEKKKTKLLSVMALKKKNIPLLVEKWQKIRKEQEKEDKIDHS